MRWKSQPGKYVSILDRFRCFVGVDSWEELAGVEEPRTLVMKFVDGLDVAPGTYNVYVSHIQSFFRYMGVEFSGVPLQRKRVVHPHKVLVRDEIRRLMEFGDIRDKAFIWFLFSSGARVSSVLGLNVGRVDLYGDAPVRVQFRATETKYNVRYDTFLCAEALAALKNYLRWRRRQGEEIMPDSPLFVTKYKGRLTYGGSTYIMKRVIEKAGIELEPGERLNHHSLRAAFQHNLQIAGVNQFIIEKLMGHAVENTVAGRYSIGLTLEDLREAYSSAEWSLEINEAKVRELETKVDETQRTLGAQTVEYSRVSEVQAQQIAELESKLEYIMKRMPKE